MVLKIAIIISSISLAMLAIYGADVIAAGPMSDSGTSQTTGFLQMNPSVRGSIFGIIPSAMLMISFFITRKEPSKKLGCLIIAGGGLIIVGTASILGIQGNLPNRTMGEFGAVLVIGIIIIILGILKLRKSARTFSR